MPTGYSNSGTNKGQFKKGFKPWNYGKKGCFSNKTREKMSNSRKGRFVAEKHPRWSGGKYKNAQGYILIYKPYHPYCDSKGYIREHRLIFEKSIGRYLRAREVIHHVNGIRDDNRIKNLELFKSNSDHFKHHYPKGSLLGQNKQLANLK